MTGDAALRRSAANNLMAGEGDPYQVLNANPVGKNKLPPIKDETGVAPAVLEDVPTMRAELLKLRGTKKSAMTPAIEARIDFLDKSLRRQDKIAASGSRK